MRAFIVIAMLLIGIACKTKTVDNRSGASAGASVPAQDNVQVGPTPTDYPTVAPVAYSAVAPIISSSCGTSNCHAAGAKQTVYVDNQANVDANKIAIYTQMSDGTMPKDSTIDDAARTALLNYCAQP